MNFVIVYGTLAAIIPLLGLVATLTPFLMPRNECFTVTVPEGAQKQDPVLRSCRHSYARWVGGATVLLTAASCVALAAGEEAAFTALLVVGVVGLCLGSYGLMLRCRSKVKARKQEMGWQASGRVSAAAVGHEAVPRPLSLKWDLLFWAMAAVTAVMALASYDQMPALIPNHIDLQGGVTEYMEKNLLTALLPALIVAFVAAVLTFSHWTIVHSKRAVDPSAPALTAWAYGMFAHAQSILLVGMGTLLSLIGPVMVLAFSGAIGLEQTAVIVLLIAMMAVVAAVAVSLVYGQNGSRLIARVGADGGRGNATLPRDDDRFWKLGIFYVNRDDPSLFLPERFGIGWTINWGRPAAWAMTASFAAVLVAFIVVTLTVSGS